MNGMRWLSAAQGPSDMTSSIKKILVFSLTPAKKEILSGPLGLQK